MPSLTIKPLTTAIGALIEGADLTRPLPAPQVTQVREVLLDKGVVFFKQQQVDDDQLRTFVANFGEPVPEPLGLAAYPQAPDVSRSNQQPVKRSTAVWHSDSTFMLEPQALTALRAVKLPPVGGDTCWASMYAAYDALSEPIRNMIDPLSGVHSLAPSLSRMDNPNTRERMAANAEHHGRSETVHPLVCVHPDTGRKALYFNEAWTVCIAELTQLESERIISLLREHVKTPEFSVRWRWEENDLALWDNRAVQHYAVPDYEGERIMQRLVTQGGRPVGPGSTS